MKILKNILAASVALVLASAAVQCKKDDKEPVAERLEIETTSLVFLSGGGSESVEVDASADWTVTVDVGGRQWCQAAREGDLLKVETQGNTLTSQRSTNVTVYCGKLTHKIEVVQAGEGVNIITDKSEIPLGNDSGTFTLKVTSQAPYTVTVADDPTWFRAIPGTETEAGVGNEKIYTFEYDANLTTSIREGGIVVKATDGEASAHVTVTQQAREPGDEEWFVPDIKVPVSNATADKAQSGEGIEKSFDGDMSTIYHSPWSAGQLPVTLTYEFSEPQRLDYILYYPRTSGSNGEFGKFTLYAKVEGSGSFDKVGDYDFGMTSSPSSVSFSGGLDRVSAVRFVVAGGKGGYASCAEMEFYRKSESSSQLEDIFTDETYSALKPGVDAKQIAAIGVTFFRDIAQALFEKSYSEFRVQEYEAYRPVGSLASEMMTSGYNPYENPTGVQFTADTELFVFVGDTRGEQLSLRVRNFDSDDESVYTLLPGTNQLKITTSGLGYIEYFTENYKSAQPIRVHITGGVINGYFDRNKHTAQQWATLLGGAVDRHFDIKGDHINLAYGVSELKKYCPTDGMELIKEYDRLVSLEFELMGLIKYDAVPKNHMFSRSQTANTAYADDIGAVFPYSWLESVASVSEVRRDPWGIAHELGHVNQIRPGLMWIGTMEVTNNVYSSYVQYKFNPSFLRLEHEDIGSNDGYVVGGRFNDYLNNGIKDGANWLFQKGNDGESDHFVKLCPLWQLMLYYKLAEGAQWHKPDWYADVCHKVRNSATTSTNGQMQVDFVKNVCDATGQDLSDFFIKAGLLKPLDVSIDDYRVQQLTITQAMCDAAVTYASRYPKPASPVIYYISGNSLDAYNVRKDVVGTHNTGLSWASGNTRCTVSHGVWKNVAAYEVYKAQELVKIAMAGAGSTNNASTVVPYPSGSTRIEAVGWDGTKTLVYGTR